MNFDFLSILTKLLVFSWTIWREPVSGQGQFEYPTAL